MITLRYLLLVVFFLALIGVGIWLAYSHRRAKDWWFYGSIISSAIAFVLLVITCREWHRQVELQLMWSTQRCHELVQAQNQYTASGDVNEWSATLAQWKAQRAQDIANHQVDVDAMDRCWANVAGTFQAPAVTTSQALSPTLS